MHVQLLLLLIHASVSWWSFTRVWVTASFHSCHAASTLTASFHRILAVLSNAIVWMVSICFQISNPSRSLSKPLETVSCVPITIGATVTIMSHSFLSTLARFKYLSLFSLSLIFTLWSPMGYSSLCGSFYL